MPNRPKINLAVNPQGSLDSYTFSTHPAATTVAKYSPSGFYIASADVQGRVLIWDTTQVRVGTLDQALTKPPKLLSVFSLAGRLVRCCLAAQLMSHPP